MSDVFSKPIVVCIDDDPDMLSVVSRCLRREALDVRATSDPMQALGWIGSEDVAVLVADYDMPLMNGAQLTGLARRMRTETVRILLTGTRTLDAAIDGINQGEIYRYIAKPFEDKHLRKTVLEAVTRHEELLELSGDRARHQRRKALRETLEAEFPGISNVGPRDPYVVTSDPWSEAEALGLKGFTKGLHRSG